MRKKLLVPGKDPGGGSRSGGGGARQFQTLSSKEVEHSSSSPTSSLPSSSSSSSSSSENHSSEFKPIRHAATLEILQRQTNVKKPPKPRPPKRHLSVPTAYTAAELSADASNVLWSNVSEPTEERDYHSRKDEEEESASTHNAVAISNPMAGLEPDAQAREPILPRSASSGLKTADTPSSVRAARQEEVLNTRLQTHPRFGGRMQTQPAGALVAAAAAAAPPTVTQRRRPSIWGSMTMAAEMPQPAKNIVCVFCLKVAEKAVMLPCHDLACLECLVRVSPTTSTCSRCQYQLGPVLELRQLTIDEATERKLEKLREQYGTRQAKWKVRGSATMAFKAQPAVPLLQQPIVQTVTRVEAPNVGVQIADPESLRRNKTLMATQESCESTDRKAGRISRFFRKVFFSTSSNVGGPTNNGGETQHLNSTEKKT